MSVYTSNCSEIAPLSAGQSCSCVLSSVNHLVGFDSGWVTHLPSLLKQPHCPPRSPLLLVAPGNDSGSPPQTPSETLGFCSRLLGSEGLLEEKQQLCAVFPSYSREPPSLRCLVCLLCSVTSGHFLHKGMSFTRFVLGPFTAIIDATDGSLSRECFSLVLASDREGPWSVYADYVTCQCQGVISSDSWSAGSVACPRAQCGLCG